MYDASDNFVTEEQIIAAVTAVVAERDALRSEREELLTERDHLLGQIDAAAAEELMMRTMQDLPNGRRWIFVEDAQLLAISTDIDADTEVLLLAQVQPPKLTTCDVCGAPVWSNASCAMH
jgi:hypothetical protein